MKKINQIWGLIWQGLLSRPLAVLALYIFVIFLFGFLYWYLNTPFKRGDNIVSLCFPDSLYFSVVTITTLGYGDISPTEGVGKLLTGLEAVSGILILGLFLSAFSHKLAIRYQRELKGKESELAIKLLYKPNWYEINQYHWHLIDAKKAIEKVKLLPKPAKECSEHVLAEFKESVLGFNNIINFHNFKNLCQDKSQAIKHLDRLFGVIDPIKYKSLLHRINNIKSTKLHVMTEKFMENLEVNLKNFWRIS